MATGEVRGMGKMKKGSSKNKSVGSLEGLNGKPLSGKGFTGFLDSGGIVGLGMDEQLCSAEMGHVYSPCFHQQGSEMFPFQSNDDQGNSEIAHKSGISGSDSSSTSSSNNSRPFSLRTESEQKRRVKNDHGSVSCAEPGSVTGSLEHFSGDSRKTLKKPKTDATPSTAPLKVKREKLGEQISALQLLVSPFGKTDTASVLHEAMGYIRFLQEQVQVLSSPYLQRMPSSLSRKGGEEETKNDLRSRGLCLVPVACTLHVANSNGADFWSPAMRSNNLKQ